MHKSKCPDGYENKWTVNQWCSHPDEGNDDCLTGDDFDTLADAKRSELYTDAPYNIQYIEIDGPVGSNHYELILNPHYDAKRVRRERAADDADWRRERAIQAGMGMGLGVEAYNEEMGYD
jgi:hypothetical protein